MNALARQVHTSRRFLMAFERSLKASDEKGKDDRTKEIGRSYIKALMRERPKDWEGELLRVVETTGDPETLKAIKETLPKDEWDAFDLTHTRRRIERTDPTRNALWEMLTENTGRVMVDSGGVNGRAWQRNQGKNFEREEECKFDLYVRTNGEDEVESLDLGIYLNVYHWLAERVTYRETETEQFQTWATTGDREDEGWWQLSRRWVEDFVPEARGIYGDGEPFTIYTYNEENCLSQDIQLVYFEVRDEVTFFANEEGEQVDIRVACDILDEDEDEILEYKLKEGYREIELDEGQYAWIQIHGGADARWGFTRPRLFEVSIEEHSILDYGRCTMSAFGEIPEWVKEKHRRFPEGTIPLPGLEEKFALYPDWIANFDERDWRQEVRWFSDTGYSWDCDRSDLASPEDWDVSTDPEHKGDGVHVFVDDDENRLYWIDGREITGYWY